MAKSSHNAPHRTPSDEVPRHPKGALVVIGGHENKEGHRPILAALAKRTGSGKLVVATLASEEPESQWAEYKKVFHELGVRHIQQLDVRRREELLHDEQLKLLQDASVIFFAGGDQMKITSKFAGTALCDRLRELYQQGATVAGTSSGASVMSDVMMVAGEGQESAQVGGSLRLAPGLGLISGVIIDQHFAERGRIGRLLAAVAENPRYLGVGIDENTALFFESDRDFLVLGSGAAYVVDGRSIAYTNAGEDTPQVMSIFGIALHVLSAGDRFDLSERIPTNGAPEEAEKKLVSSR